MDDQSTFMGCVQRCFALFDGTAEPIKREIPAEEPEAEDNTEDNEPEQKQATSSTAQENHQHTNTKNQINMANYPKINAACGMQDGQQIEVKEEGAFMNAPLLDTLEAHLASQEQAVADAKVFRKEAGL